LELSEVAARISAELFGGIPFNLGGFDEIKGGELKADILGLGCRLYAFDPPDYRFEMRCAVPEALEESLADKIQPDELPADGDTVNINEYVQFLLRQIDGIEC
jgi:hypothetical protein